MRTPGIRERDRVMSRLVTAKGATYVSVYDAVCRDGRCDEFAEGDVPLQFDAGHLTAEGSVEVARRLVDRFADNGEGRRCFELIGRRRSTHLDRCAIVAALWLLAAVCGKSGACRVMSTSNSAKFAGAFVNWGPIGREHTLQVWEKWLRQKPSSVLGVDFYAQSTWDDFSRLSWVPGIWKKLNPARNVVWSVPLTVKGTPLADVADGLHDAEFEAAAQAIAEAQPKAIIRLGWEMNLGIDGLVRQGPGGRLHQGIPARRWNIQAALQPISRYDWCPGWGPQDSAADLAYPGDDVVDYIGLDVYDFKYDGSAEERWNKFYLKAPFGLEWQRDFAARHGKPHELSRMGRRQFRRQSVFRSADARLVRAERRQHRLCGLFRRRRVVADTDRQRPVSQIAEAVQKAFRALSLVARRVRCSALVNAVPLTVARFGERCRPLDRILQRCAVRSDSSSANHRAVATMHRCRRTRFRFGIERQSRRLP